MSDVSKKPITKPITLPRGLTWDYNLKQFDTQAPKTPNKCDCGTTFKAHSVFCPAHPSNEEV